MAENEEDFGTSTMASLMDLDEEPKQEVKQPEVKDIKISKEISRYQDINTDDSFEEIRRVVKDVGRETSPLRMTSEESTRLEETVFKIKMKNKLKTDKNQVARISLNYMLNDFEENGKNSILVQVLERLNA